MADKKPTHQHSQATVENRAVEESLETPDSLEPQLQALAYQLWLERGSPIGSPEVDWFEAEARLAVKGDGKKTMTATP